MTATLEISMYPLQPDYREQILEFLRILHEHKNMDIKVNALSTQIQGDYDDTFAAVREATKSVYSSGVKASFIIKVLPGDIDLGYEYGR